MIIHVEFPVSARCGGCKSAPTGACIISPVATGLSGFIVVNLNSFDFRNERLSGFVVRQLHEPSSRSIIIPVAHYFTRGNF